MTGVRNTGFVVSLALLASIVGHIAIQRHFERRAQNRPVSNQTMFSSASNPDLGPPAHLFDERHFNSPQFAAKTSHHAQVIPAVDSHEQGSDEQGFNEQSQHLNRPQPAVPAPADALPLEAAHDAETSSRDSDTSAVRDVIEHELSHATREERDIWYEELKSLPAGVVADLLQVRKQLHALPKLLGGMPEKLVSSDPTISTRTQEIAAEPASQKIRFNLPDHSPSSTALEMAISQLRHNLMNAATPGFKRLRVTLVDSYGSSWQGTTSLDDSGIDTLVSNRIQGEGCRIAPLLLDLKQGGLNKTGRQLDLAIDGEGFYVVHFGEKEFLTRCGAFTLDRNRQICLAVSNGNAVLQPVMTIPDDAREIQISAAGVVTLSKAGETSFITIGQLQLARVPSPTRLQPVGQTLFVATKDSGDVELGVPMSSGRGELQQGFVEQTNVDFDQELAEIEKLMEILNAMPSPSSRPATARSVQHSVPR